MSLISKLKPTTLVGSLYKVTKIPIRYGGHGPRRMILRQTYHAWNQFKDYYHFYIFLGVVPLSIFTFCMNVFIGPAELREIPEGYTPHYYEYFKNPVSRFCAKYIYYDKARDYETLAAKYNEEAESYILKKIKTELNTLMRERKDNKSYYYSPLDLTQHLHYKNRVKNDIFNSGIQDAKLD